MVLSEAEVTNGFERGIVKTHIGSRNVACRVGMWVIGYELSTRGGAIVWKKGESKHWRLTFGVSYEDCYAREISRFVCNICWIELNCLQYLF